MTYAEGDLFVLIDDDEWASSDDWLKQLIATMDDYRADMVFGVVKVHYPEGTPDWVIQGDMLGKDDFPHGKN